MSGIYIHIPFCKQACSYCNFHFSTSLKYKGDVVNAICKEIDLRHEYLSSKSLKSVYFGGGTPSLLEINEFNKIINTLKKYYTFEEGIEITIEANPDDLSMDSLDKWKNTEVNRLSIGVQSFKETDLVFMNRAHNKNEAYDCIENAQKVGFNNLSVDLIYGTPGLSHDDWKNNIQTLIDHKIPHISAYALTVEEKTLLHHQVKMKKVLEPEEIQASEQFEILMQMLNENGYVHYEISNFCLPGKYAVHNTSYWQGKLYLGIGPAAHSFNGKTRSWNIANNGIYLRKIGEGILPLEEEILSANDQFNEYLMTGLRTQWGIELGTIKNYGKKYLNSFLAEVKPFVENGDLDHENGWFKLTNKGKLIADRIISSLFYVS